MPAIKVSRGQGEGPNKYELLGPSRGDPRRGDLAHLDGVLVFPDPPRPVDPVDRSRGKEEVGPSNPVDVSGMTRRIKVGNLAPPSHLDSPRF